VTITFAAYLAKLVTGQTALDTFTSDSQENASYLD
jgi:hypothetical protein